MQHNLGLRARVGASLVLLALLPSLVRAQSAPAPFAPSRQIDRRVAALLRQMTRAEKIGQLVQFANGVMTGPDTGPIDQQALLARGGMGSILGATGARTTNALQRQTMEHSRLKIPLLFGMDVIHGYRTTFPIPLGLSASWDPDLIERTARVAAVEATADGVRWTFAPMVDIARDARWGRIMEGSGEDPYLGGRIAAAYVRGFQGKDLSDSTSLLACTKHFVAYGAAEGGRDYNTVDVSERVLRDVYLPPFQAALAAGVGTFMSGFNTVNGVPATANRHTLTEILRTEWGFQGFVVSDWNSVGELVAHGTARDGGDATLQAVTAGVDMDMSSNLYATRLLELVRDGKIKEAAIDQAVTRVLRLKVALGLFEHPYTDEARSATDLLKPEHLALARQAAEASFVLLKNGPETAPVLPLAEEKTVALIGPLADSPEEMLGAWSCKGEGKDVVTLRHALSERIADRLLYAQGTEIETESDAGFAAAVAAAKRADVVVMALGEARAMSGEASSRTRLDLPGNQRKLLEAVAATGKPIVLCLFSGRPLALPTEAARVSALLAAWYPGVQAGPALVRTLYGDVNPSGKITASFPRSVGQMPLYYNTFNTGRPRTARNPTDRNVTGYIDEASTPLFPFGWGLSYTTFVYAPTQITTRAISAEAINRHGGMVTVEASVTNTGTRAGTEIVQCYIGERGTSVARPVRELKGFQRLALAPGETRRVRFTLTAKELSFWTRDDRQSVEPCELTVWIAPHAQGGQPDQIAITR